MSTKNYFIFSCCLTLIVMQNVLAQAPENNNVIDNITIVGEKSLPGSVCIITVEDLEKFETIDVHKALAMVPGINIRPKAYFSLQQRTIIGHINGPAALNTIGSNVTANLKPFI